LRAAGSGGAGQAAAVAPHSQRRTRGLPMGPRRTRARAQRRPPPAGPHWQAARLLRLPVRACACECVVRVRTAPPVPTVTRAGSVLGSHICANKDPTGAASTSAPRPTARIRASGQSALRRAASAPAPARPSRARPTPAPRPAQVHISAGTSLAECRCTPQTSDPASSLLWVPCEYLVSPLRWLAAD
jgi:hypothetical protein